MLNTNNVIILKGGLTRDPEMVNDDKLVVFGIGVDNSGLEGGKTASGFFEVKFWLTESKFSAEAAVETVKEGIANGTLKKGTRVEVIGKIVHERWEKNGQKGSKHVIVAENLSFYVASKGNAAGGNEVTTGTVNNNEPPRTFDASSF